MADRAQVNPGMLRHLRSETGLTVADAARVADVDEDVFRRVEKGERFLTPRQARQLARRYGASFAYLYLAPPAELDQADPKHLFRRFHGIPEDERNWTPEVRESAREALEVRDLALELEAQLGEKPAYPRLRIQAGLNGPQLAAALRRALGISVDDQQGFKEPTDALRAWRRAVERLGVVVMQSSFVPRGSSGKQRVRGFVLLDDRLPVIVLNRHDQAVAQIFTLIHELVHALLSTQGSSLAADEVFCNRVAAATLLPRDVFLEIAGPWFGAGGNLLEAARRVAGSFRVSIRATLIRAEHVGLIDDGMAYTLMRRLSDAAPRRSGGAGQVDNAQGRAAINHYGRAYVELVVDALRGEQLSYDLVPSYLGDFNVDRLPEIQNELARTSRVVS